MPPRIGILGNCQRESLAIALGALLPEAEILSVDLNGVADADRARAAASLAECDHVISQDVAPGYGPLSTRALRAAARRYHLMPAFTFGGFHPDCITVTLDHASIPTPVGGLHSRIVVAGVLAGLSAEEIVELFNPLVFARLGYFGALAENRALVIEKFAAYAIDLAPFIGTWCAGGCFMVTPHRPKMVVALDLARIACGMMGLAPQASPPVTSLRDPMAALSAMPFLPLLADRWGMQPDGAFRDALPARPLTLAEFVTGSVASLARAPLASLRAAQGVAAAMDRLGVRAAKRPPRAAPAAGSHGLLSRHGTILRIEAASSLLVQKSLWPPGSESSDFTLTPSEGDDGAVRADILGGLDIVPGSASGTIRVSRQGRWLTAAAGSLAVPFRGENAGADNAFLAVDLPAIAALRDILSRGWVWEEQGCQAAAARLRMRADFLLDFGIFAVDLRQALPRALADDGGYRFDTREGAITIRPAPAAAGPEIALLPDPRRTLPDEAGSIPEFRTSVRASWLASASDDILHPPLTADDRDTAWLLERCAWPGGLPAGLARRQAMLRRMPDRVVAMAPGLEGLVFDRGGALTAFAPPVVAGGLPAGWRAEEGALLIGADGLDAAPVVTETAAVCVCPGMGDDDGWPVEMAVRLHVMAPFLPRGVRLLVPPGFSRMAGDGLGVLAAMGLNQWPVLEAPGPVCRLTDAVWLDDGRLSALPEAVLRDVRARIAALIPPPSGPRTRLYIKRAGTRRIADNEAFDRFLAVQGFTVVVPEELTPAARIALFRGAEMVMGAHGRELADIVFCQDGTRVLEISPRAQFRPRYWMLAEKCGLIHGVLPCATAGGFDGVLSVDVVRLRALFRVLRLFMES